MNTALRVMGLGIVLLAMTATAGEAEEICFPDAFSMRMTVYEPYQGDVVESTWYVDIRAQKQRVDDPAEAARYYYDYATGFWYWVRPDVQVCVRQNLTVPPPQWFCLSRAARRVGVEDFAGRTVERWCEDTPDGTCYIGFYTVMDRNQRLPFMAWDSHFMEVFTDLEARVPPSVFKLPRYCPQP
jgi:hypothetical protein